MLAKGRLIRGGAVAALLALVWAYFAPRGPALVALPADEEVDAPPEGPPPQALLRMRPTPPRHLAIDLPEEDAGPAVAPAIDPAAEAARDLARQAELIAGLNGPWAAPAPCVVIELPKKKHPDWPIFTDDELGLRQAMRRGWRDYQRALKLHGDAALWAFDRARRDMSEGLLLPEMSDPALRAPLEEAIAFANAKVYGSKTPMVGVTEVIRVEWGDIPQHIVDRRPYGPNAILYWTQKGKLDPKHLPARDPTTIPVEPLWLFVDRSWHVLFVFLGDAFVKEFPVAVGKSETPTPAGTFAVANVLDFPSKSRRFPKLGSAWIRVRPVIDGQTRWWGDGGTSIHGTNEPDSIGSDASDGSIRLRNADATEVLGWVNTRAGPERRVVIR